MSQRGREKRMNETEFSVLDDLLLFQFFKFHFLYNFLVAKQVQKDTLNYNDLKQTK